MRGLLFVGMVSVNADFPPKGNFHMKGSEFESRKKLGCVFEIVSRWKKAEKWPEKLEASDKKEESRALGVFFLIFKLISAADTISKTQPM
jgi:hypothetical protein